MNKLPQRKQLAHPPPTERFNQPVVLFVTACIQNEDFTLSCKDAHIALLQAWEMSNAWRVGAYMIMPDHLHLFCVPGTFPPFGIKNWNKFWKGQFRRITKLDRTVWQRDCWDTQMRNYDHYVEKRSYVRENPVRKGLVARTEDWPYQGELHVIRW